MIIERRASTEAPSSYNADRTHRPYRLLWVKVIIRAAYDYALWRESKDLRLRKYAHDAEKWLFESSKLAWGFESICYLFKLDVEWLRRNIRELTREDVKKLEFKERQSRDLLPALGLKRSDNLDGDGR